MPFSSLSRLGLESPLRIQVLCAGDDASIAFAGLVQPLRLAEKLLGPARISMQVQSLESVFQAASTGNATHLILIVADHEPLQLTAQNSRLLLEHCRTAKVWGAVGSAVLWLARSGEMNGLRTALPRALDVEVGEIAESAILTPHLFELDGDRLTCCGGAASIDFSLPCKQKSWKYCVSSRCAGRGIDSKWRRKCALPRCNRSCRKPCC